MRFCIGFALSLALSGAAYAQQPAAEPATLLTTYQLTFRPDSTAPVTRTEEIRLLIGAHWSQSESQGKHLLDSAFTAFASLPETPESAEQIGKFYSNLPRTGFRHTVYKNLSSRKLIWHELINTTPYQYEEALPVLAWHLMPDTATITGYHCQRATVRFGGRTFDAWFTRQVPVSEGPYKFYGLPGLIVRVGDTRQSYTYTLTSLRKPQHPPLIALPDKAVATVTSRDKLQQASAALERSVADRLAALGQSVSEEDRRAYQQRLKRRNNPIELR